MNFYEKKAVIEFKKDYNLYILLRNFKIIAIPLIFNLPLFFIICISTESYSANTYIFKANDTICQFFWTQSANETNKYGYYGILKITGQNQTPYTLNYTAFFRLDSCSFLKSRILSIETNI